ncbi:MAG TPA: IS3 family transposase, partial [Gemmataceae bacterium]|nr:IS3 family transposase [Gemmataceae bacterium]
MRYQAVRATPRGLSVARRCELLDVSRSGYYAAQHRPASARAMVNQQLVVEIRRIHREVDRSYESPRMQPELVGAGFACGRHRVARLMRTAGIQAKQPNQYCVTTDSRHRFAIAPNRLDRVFSAPAPNRVWMGDMTYIPTAEGWCFLAVLIDAFSRRVVGWALDTQLSASLPLTAWHQAVASRQPGPGLVHHSDRGSQYAGTAYQTVLQQHAAVCSMSRSGDCWDNAVVESFFAALKVERLHERQYTTREELEADVRDYIETFYNRRRRHSTLGYLSPVMFEL